MPRRAITDVESQRSALNEKLYRDSDHFQQLSFNDVGECYSGLSKFEFDFVLNLHTSSCYRVDQKWTTFVVSMY